jgi:serine protease inhibitor
MTCSRGLLRTCRVKQFDIVVTINIFLSGMRESSDLFVEAVLHNACMEVDEQGTKAAAATAVMMGNVIVSDCGSKILSFFTARKCISKVNSFVVDRPFLFSVVNLDKGYTVCTAVMNSIPV